MRHDELLPRPVNPPTGRRTCATGSLLAALGLAACAAPSLDAAPEPAPAPVAQTAPGAAVASSDAAPPPAAAGAPPAAAGAPPAAAGAPPAAAGAPPPDVQRRQQRFEERTQEVRARAERFFTDHAVAAEHVALVTAELEDLHRTVAELLAQPAADKSAHKARKTAVRQEVDACAARIDGHLGPDLGTSFKREVLAAAVGQGQEGGHGEARGNAAE